MNVSQKVSPANTHLFKVRDSIRWDMCSKLTIKAPEQRQWNSSDVFIINLEHISPFILEISCRSFRNIFWVIILGNMKKQDSTLIRGNRWQIFCKKAVLKKCYKIRKCFPVNFVKFVTIDFWQNTSQRLLLVHPCTNCRWRFPEKLWDSQEVDLGLLQHPRWSTLW